MTTEHSEEAHAKAKAEAKEAHAKAKAEAKEAHAKAKAEAKAREAHAKADLAEVMAIYAAAMEEAGYTRLDAIKALTKEEWPTKVRVPAAVGELAEQPEPTDLVMDPDAWEAFLDVHKASHTLTFPIVLYGPGDTVKLKVLLTWMSVHGQDGQALRGLARSLSSPSTWHPSPASSWLAGWQAPCLPPLPEAVRAPRRKVCY